MDKENWTYQLTEFEKKKKARLIQSRKEKLSTFDWMVLNDINDIEPFDIFEVSFKQGARKEFCKNINKLDITTGSYVVVDSGNGYDIGKVSLSGDLVRLQMRKRKVTDCQELSKIVRFASEYDMNKLHEARNMEYDTMVRARAIAASLDLDMKIGDVEYQADKRKATFFYTSDGRVDFRELVKIYAKEFKVKIEMRQIGIRQESSKIGGIGSCGRELCCSTWHTNFTSVTTEMVRYQNLSVNQTKLTGLCGRLKCCLNYELDTYLEALKDFPKKADSLKLKYNMAYLVKMDIFKGIMYYSIKDENDRIKIYAVPKERVFEIKEMNEKNQFPENLGAILYLNEDTGDDMDFEDVTGQIELPEEKRKKRNKRKIVKSRKRNKNSEKELNKNDNNQNNSSNSDKSNKRRHFNKNKRNKKF